MRVIKLGGSLLDWPGCFAALSNWMAGQETMANLIVVGGGAPVEALRQREMSDEQAHWEAIRLMERNAAGFAQAHNLQVSQELRPINAAIVVLTCLERRIRVSDLPVGWQVTSDSISAWIACEIGADELVLMKSCACDGDALVLANAGVVDDYFPVVSKDVNWRAICVQRDNVERNSFR